MYIKALEEVWDPFQLKVADVGGNKAFYEYMRDYEKEREPIAKKYKNDAAYYYKKLLYSKAVGEELTEIPPPKNAKELAERTAKDAQQTIAKGVAATSEFFKETDEKYQIKQKTLEAAEKAKNSLFSLFGSKKAPEQPATAGQQ